MFDDNHFHIEANFDITDFAKVSEQSSIFFFYKEGYIQLKSGIHIITGVP